MGSKQLDIVAHGLAIEDLEIVPLALEQGVVADRSELLDAQLAALRRVMNLARIDVSQILAPLRRNPHRPRTCARTRYCAHRYRWPCRRAPCHRQPASPPGCPGGHLILIFHGS